MLAWVRDLDSGQKRGLTALAAVVGALALATGAVVMSDDGSSEATVQTEDDGTTTTRASSTTSSSTSTSTSVLDTSTTTASTSAGGGATTTTPRRSPGGGGGGAGTTQPPTTSPPDTTPPDTTPPTEPPQDEVCNSGGGTAGQMANKFCAHRANLGLPTMTRNGALDQMAQEWAAKIAADQQLSHRPDAAQMIAARCDCPGWSENVAFDETVDQAWSEWLKSTQGHRENIEDGRDGEYGIGVASAGGYLWFVQVFGYY